MIGNKIYKFRKQRGFSISELAERAKISKSYLSNIERNLNSNPSIKVIEKISSVLQVDLSDLINSELKEVIPLVEEE
jgi:XRE family transcriptional regulator, master regulator for biofilm formation